jgi:hypothetical protein
MARALCVWVEEEVGGSHGTVQGDVYAHAGEGQVAEDHPFPHQVFCLPSTLHITLFAHPYDC